MEGRKKVRGFGDRTAVRREKKSGEIFGRTKPIKKEVLKKKVGLAKATIPTRKRVSRQGVRARRH